MPAVRLSRRRRSSLAMSFNPAKAGIYGINAPSPRPVTFAPNVTPGTFVEPDSGSSSSTPEPGSPTSTLFPPSQSPAPAPSRRRVPPGKRRSLGYIPRPPNAFMLFRADFVRQKHVPGSIETNHGSLSKIIGNCWRSLPLEEKRVWEVKAKHAKAEHKAIYPDYRFRPVHNKNKEKKKEKPTTTMEDERRCEEVAQLLLEGKKGEDLAAAVRHLDHIRKDSPPPPLYPHRRSSSVPLPGTYFQPHSHNNIALPSLPFLSHSRPTSPVNAISRQQQRLMLGGRRASSARPAGLVRSWTMPSPTSLQRDDSPLPEVDTSLFEQSFLDAANANFFPMHDNTANFAVNDLLTSLPPHANHHPSPHAPGPFDSIAPHQIPLLSRSYNSSSANSLPELDPLTWLPLQSSHHSHPSSAYSGSPAPSEHSIPPIVHAPQPQHANHLHQHPSAAPVFTDMWKEFEGSCPGAFAEQQGFEQMVVGAGGANANVNGAHGLGLDFGAGGDMSVPMNMNMNMTIASASAGGCGDRNVDMQNYATTAGLESLFEPATFDSGFGYEFNEMMHE